MIAGVDISHFNPFPNTEGLSFMFLKAGEGTYYRDPVYIAHRAIARAKGLKTGAYWFTSGGDVNEQYRRFSYAIDKDSVIVLDVEENYGAEGVLNKAQLEEFIALIYRNNGVYPIIYSRENYLNGLLKGEKSTAYQCPLWISTSLSEPTLPLGWSTWAFHQYGEINGFDADRLNESWWSLNSFWAVHTPKRLVKFVTADALNVRAAPNTASPILRVLKRGEMVQLGVYTLLNEGYLWAELFDKGYVATNFTGDMA